MSEEEKEKPIGELIIEIRQIAEAFPESQRKWVSQLYKKTDVAKKAQPGPPQLIGYVYYESRQPKDVEEGFPYIFSTDDEANSHCGRDTAFAQICDPNNILRLLEELKKRTLALRALREAKSLSMMKRIVIQGLGEEGRTL